MLVMYWHVDPGMVACWFRCVDILASWSWYVGMWVLVCWHVGPGVLHHPHLKPNWLLFAIYPSSAQFKHFFLESFLFFLKFLKVKVRGASVLLSALNLDNEMWPVVLSNLLIYLNYTISKNISCRDDG